MLASRREILRCNFAFLKILLDLEPANHRTSIVVVYVKRINLRKYFSVYCIFFVAIAILL